jgi:hypothetical protein
MVRKSAVWSRRPAPPTATRSHWPILFTIKRGLATDANDFFIRPRKEIETWLRLSSGAMPAPSLRCCLRGSVIGTAWPRFMPWHYGRRT